MNDDLGKKVQQIAQMLGQDSVPDNVMELVSMFASSLGSKENTADSQSAPPEPEKAEMPAAAEPAETSEMMDAARKVLDRINTGNDARINLLYAIKPFMSSNRQKKVSNCIQLLQVAGLSRLFNERKK